MYELLDSLHQKILKSTFAEEVTESEIIALIKAKEIFKDKSDTEKSTFEHLGR